MRKEQQARSAPLLLCAAIALALPGCGTKSGQSDQVVADEPVVATPAEMKVDDIEEMIIARSRAKPNVLHPPAELKARERDYMSNAINVDQLLRQVQQGSVQSKRIAQFSAHAPIQNTENYASIENNSMKQVKDEPVSTFSIDVDTGAYANVRRFLNNDQLPPQDAVRVEELINYFNYDYPEPTDTDTPFSVSTELSRTPWNKDTWLLQVGLKGYDVPASERPSANLVFLLDVSGSMNSPNKLPLLKKAFKLLTRQLNEEDRVSIVVYAGASGVVLEPTAGDEQRTIMAALRKLQAGGSTNGAEGIELAYTLAEEAFIEDGINRIVLATDGDFNVGTVNFEQLKDMAERKRKTGISLTTLGFGTGNYNDNLMEQLADAGNGNYAYIDSQQEARKVLVNEVTSTLHTIAKDVKIQIEFNPDVVAEYRLIGYENRMLKREDFTNDKVDAGEIGAGHTVTALYELIPASSDSRSVIPLRYQSSDSNNDALTQPSSTEAAFVRLRYKKPGGDISKEVSQPIFQSDLRPLRSTSDNLRFSASVAAFGQLLNGSAYLGDYSMEDIDKLARSALAQDKHGYRHEFIDLVNAAEELLGEMPGGRVAQTDE